METLNSLRNCSNTHQLSALLGYKASMLSYLAFKSPVETRYREEFIPKKSGGHRRLCIPNVELMALQRRLARILNSCQDELEKQKYSKEKTLTDPAVRSISHGFKRNHSIATNARKHKNKKYVFNVDLKDFFPSINFGRVRGYFIKNKDYLLNDRVATIIAQIACYRNELPQGSPTSPIISNFIAHPLDVRLAQLAGSHKCYYTRYADDLTFSSSVAEFPAGIAYLKNPAEFLWAPGDILSSEIRRSGFRINDSKTRMQIKPSRQVVTGLIVNEKINAPRDLYKAVRAMCFRLFKDGNYDFPYIKKDLHPTGSTPETRDDLRPIEALLGYLYFLQKFNSTISIKDGEQNLDTQARSAKIARELTTTSVGKLRADLLFYKYFVSNKKPVVVCEGKTDGVYLKCALNSLKSYHSRLKFYNSKGHLENSVHFLKCSRPVMDLLHLGVGEGELKKFIEEFPDRLLKYKHKPMNNPVIVLVDNDDGAKHILAFLRGKYNLKVSHHSKDDFYFVTDNLYIIKTQERGPGTGAPELAYSNIEDYFEKSVLKEKLGTLVFNPKKEHNAAGEYGKDRFANEVVKVKQNSINFDGFTQVFDRIVAVLDHYNMKIAN